MLKVTFLGPNKQAQVVMIRGLVEDWQYPYFVDFDRNVDKNLYDQVIVSLEDLGGSVLASTCDQGGSNDGLIGKLGISEDNPCYQNPAYPNDPEKVVYFLHDYVHVEKLWRNNLLQHSVTLEDGQTFQAKEHFQELYDYCKGHEVSEGYYLKDILIHCHDSDLQTVKFAVNLMSNTTASLFRQYFPNDSVKMALADMCDIFHNGRIHLDY